MKAPCEPLTPARAVDKRLDGIWLRRGYAALVVRIAVIALAAWLLFTQVFMLTQAHGGGMYPAVKDGDLVIGYRLQDRYQKGDVIVFQQAGVTRVGRIAALSTDTVTMNANGTLLVNGTPQLGDILYPTYPREGDTFEAQVPEDAFYVLGDYRTQCMDSRDFGPVPIEDVQCKVITILRRRGI